MIPLPCRRSAAAPNAPTWSTYGHAPRVAGGTKLVGGNLTVKPGMARWNEFWTEWDWEGWIKPQIDGLKALGGNAVRCIGGANAIFCGEMSRETYFARLAQVIDYCASLGMYYYPCLGYGRELSPIEGYTNVSIPDWIVEIGTHVQYLTPARFPGIIGFDILQEVHDWSQFNSSINPATLIANCQAIYDALKPLTTIPLTYSFVLGFNNEAGAWSDASFVELDGCTDYYDIHVYWTPTTAAAANAFAAANHGKAVLIGEIGVNMATSSAARTARYQGLKTIHESLPFLVGSLAWALADQAVSPDGQWGILDSNNAFAPRTDVTDLFRTLKKTR